MQRFETSAAKYSYSPRHEAIGTVEDGEQFAVDCVEGFGNAFTAPEDFTPARYAEAEKLKWAVTGPIDVAGATAGAAVAVTIHSVKPTTPGVVVYGSYTAEDPYLWWDEETACDIYRVTETSVVFDDRTTLSTRPLIGCLAARPAREEFHARLQGTYGGNLDCKALTAGATLVLPVEHDGAGLYFGDCKALMGDGEIVGPPEIGALVVASVRPCNRPAAMTWPRLESESRMTTLVSGKPLEWSARQAYRELLEWIVEDYEIERPKAALLMAMVADAGICQISNDEYTAYCTTPRDIWRPYSRA